MKKGERVIVMPQGIYGYLNKIAGNRARVFDPVTGRMLITKKGWVQPYRGEAN